MLKLAPYICSGLALRTDDLDKRPQKSRGIRYRVGYTLRVTL